MRRKYLSRMVPLEEEDTPGYCDWEDEYEENECDDLSEFFVHDVEGNPIGWGFFCKKHARMELRKWRLKNGDFGYPAKKDLVRP